MDGSGGPPTPPPPPPLASDADTHAAGASDPPTVPGRRPHTWPAKHAASAATPHSGGHLLNGSSITNHRQHCAIPLLGHTHLPHTGVSRINRSSCQPSAETM